MALLQNEEIDSFVIPSNVEESQVSASYKDLSTTLEMTKKLSCNRTTIGSKGKATAMHTRKADLAAIKTLTDRSDFLDIQSNGKKWVSTGLVVRIKENDLGTKRVGFTVSKRVDKSAVKRNRIKRRLRAVAADVLSKYAKDNTDYVILGRKETMTRPYETLINDLKWCLKKTGYYCKTDT